MAFSRAPSIAFSVAKDRLTGQAGRALVATFLDLPARLARAVRVKVRQRGCCDRDMLLSLIYSFEGILIVLRTESPDQRSRGNTSCTGRRTSGFA